MSSLGRTIKPEFMSAAVQYRPGLPDDALCIAVLATQVFLDTYAAEGVRPDLAREAIAVYSHQAFAARLSDPTTRFVLAEMKGRLVAFAELAVGKPCPAPSAAQVEVVRLYVQRNFHRQGIGRALSEHAERIAAEQGFHSIWLAAWSGNSPALAFYPALGYKDVGATAYIIEGQAYENRVFVKEPLHGAV
jgi:GNAT superfamily N-acetyltransferase